MTGVLLAGLFGQRKSGGLLPRLQHGPVRTVHAVPGRVRFRLRDLAMEPSQADMLRDRIASIEGVRSVDVTPASGSVLIVYRQKAVQPELLFAAVVRVLGLDRELARTPKPAIARELRLVLDSLNRVVYDRTNGLLDFSTSVLILLAGLGLKSLIVDKSKSFPPGLTLIWWGVNRLLGRGED